MKGKALMKVMFPHAFGKPTKNEQRIVTKRALRSALMISGKYRKF